MEKSRRPLLPARNVRFGELRARCARKIASSDCALSSGRMETLLQNQCIAAAVETMTIREHDCVVLTADLPGAPDELTPEELAQYRRSSRT